jgi:excisionase family DNA binding protein
MIWHILTLLCRLLFLLYCFSHLWLVETLGMLSGERVGSCSEGMLMAVNQAGHALLTLAEAAAYLRVHPRTMTRLLQARQVTGVRVGRQWRIRQTDLDAYLTAGTRSNAEGHPDWSPGDNTPAG